MKKIVLTLMLLGATLMANPVYTKSYKADADSIYPKLLQAFDKAHLVVVSQIDILDKFRKAGLPKKFGKNFNTNNLTAIKAIIACNGFFGNAIANSDPKMMAYCPIRVTLIQEGDTTTLMYVTPDVEDKESAAAASLKKLSNKVIGVLNSL